MNVNNKESRYINYSDSRNSKKLLDLFNNDFHIEYDYDLEYFNECLENDDFDSIMDIVGDRDLAEFL